MQRGLFAADGMVRQQPEELKYKYIRVLTDWA